MFVKNLGLGKSAIDGFRKPATGLKDRFKSIKFTTDLESRPFAPGDSPENFAYTSYDGLGRGGLN